MNKVDKYVGISIFVIIVIAFIPLCTLWTKGAIEESNQKKVTPKNTVFKAYYQKYTFDKYSVSIDGRDQDFKKVKGDIVFNSSYVKLNADNVNREFKLIDGYNLDANFVYEGYDNNNKTNVTIVVSPSINMISIDYETGITMHFKYK